MDRHTKEVNLKVVTYNGNLEKCDNWMNLNLREVICTSRVREHAIALSRAAPIAQLSFSRGRG